MYNYILDFLSQRSIRFKVGNAVSDEFIIENGIPQGSVISPILFNIMINDIYEKLGDSNEGLLYADDAVIWRRGCNISYVNDKIQKDIHVFEQWGIDWGFKFSITKSQVVYFTRKKVPETYKIMLYNQQLERSENLSI